MHRSRHAAAAAAKMSRRPLAQSGELIRFANEEPDEPAADLASLSRSLSRSLNESNQWEK